MKLDNEDQRVILTSILQSTPIHGTFAEMKQATASIEALLIAIDKAQIETTEEK